MPDHCSVPGCKSGYETKEKAGRAKVSFHKFPEKVSLRMAWLKAIHRDLKTWTPTTYSRVCSVHFREDDYTASRDTNIHRKQKRQNTRRSLKKEAVPSVFPNLPGYLSTPPPTARETSASSSQRWEKQQRAMESEVQAFFQADSLSSLDDLRGKVDKVVLPAGIDKVFREKDALFFSLSVEGPLKIHYSLSVNQDLSCSATLNSVPVPEKSYTHLLTGKKATVSGIGNVMAFLKGQWEQKTVQKSLLEEFIHQTTEKLLELAQAVDDPAIFKKVAFLAEQLTLSTKIPATRRYSQDLLACSAMWENQSPSLYRHMTSEGILSLPSKRWIHQLTKALSLGTGLQPSSLSYLKARSKSLTEEQKLVILLIDEIYCAQKLEYASGKIHGLDKGELSKTLLSFMIKSVRGNYSDMVALCPTKNLDAEKLQSETAKVLDALESLGFDVLLISTDNASPNRKYFFKLSGSRGSLQTSVANPVNPEKELFLIFDSVHDFKNLYNNFQTRKVFCCPTFDSRQGLLHPSFHHVEELYKLEWGKPAKIAYKLSDKVLHPSALEKTNVQLADSFFHDSTIEALRFYSTSHPEWRQTADFLEIVRKWWNRVNVKSRFLGQKKKDESRMPITSVDDENLLLLSRFSSWLEE